MQANNTILWKCGRWGFPPQMLEHVTLDEFQDFIAGALEREKEQYRIASHGALVVANTFTKEQRKVEDVLRFTDGKKTVRFTGPNALVDMAAYLNRDNHDVD